MLKIKLSQVGQRHGRSYRIVIAEARSKRDGQALEKIGSYNPKATAAQVVIDKKRLEYWVKNGAQMTDTVRRIIK
jgi:small subunit ribosomal protein S16